MSIRCHPKSLLNVKDLFVDGGFTYEHVCLMISPINNIECHDHLAQRPGFTEKYVFYNLLSKVFYRELYTGQ